MIVDTVVSNLADDGGNDEARQEDDTTGTAVRAGLPRNVPEGDRKAELPALLAQLIREAATRAARNAREADMNRITADHSARKPIVHVRQPSENQVRRKTGSQEWQYGLEARAEALGWTDVTVIDQDLGLSGSGRTRLPGFRILLYAVCNREVGIILSVDASRLARNGRERHALPEFCGIAGCLLADHACARICECDPGGVRSDPPCGAKPRSAAAWPAAAVPTQE